VRRLILLIALLAGCTETLESANTSCESCHRPLDTPPGIEVPHALFAVACIECHAGDPEVKTIAGAHIANPGPLDIRNASRDELAAIVADYRRFINPSDPVSAPVTCGTKGSDGCHQAIVDSVSLSVHSTAVGLLNPQRHDLGLAPARTPVVGVVARGDLTALAVPAVPTATASNLGAFQELAFAKDCTGCHLSVYGAVGQGRPQNRFASGCAACHMVYAEDGLGGSADPTLNKSEPGHPVAHQLTNQIPDRQCEYCHFRSLRIGPQYRGLRELTALDVELGLPDAKRNEAPLHGYPAGFYIEDDDAKTAGDFTPPDVHYKGGLACVDCHVGQDVHGDGHLQPSMAKETGIECSDCHGTFERAAGDTAGVFTTTGGAKLARLRREADGRVLMKGALDGVDHPVTQLVELERNIAVDQAHDTGNHGDLECYACHTAWMQSFYLVERTLDLREMSASPIDGKMTAGRVTERNVAVTLDALLLGENPDGKIGTFMAKNELLTVIAPCDPRLEPVGCESTPEQPIFGKKIIDRALAPAADGKLPLTFVPAFAHTVASKANVRACETCHPRRFEADLSRPRAVFGYGRGILATLTGTTATADVSRIVGENGAAVVPFGVPGTGPVPLRKIQRALEYRVSR